MLIHTRILWAVAQDVYSAQEFIELQRAILAVEPYPEPVAKFDLSMGGPSLTRLSCAGHGRYHIDDREIFRPLQYCHRHFEHGYQTGDFKWETRRIVQDSSLHIEALVKRVTATPHLPLGQALRSQGVKQVLGVSLWSQLDRFTRVYNDAKHDMSHPKDTHMFSLEDALLAYFISRKCGLELYQRIRLSTNLVVFSQPC